MEEIFIERIRKSNVFTKEEIDCIINNKLYKLFERCYLLGLLDNN